ncbi:hypothetical protein D1872_314050 [compost metagenome]
MSNSLTEGEATAYEKETQLVTCIFCRSPPYFVCFVYISSYDLWNLRFVHQMEFDE